MFYKSFLTWFLKNRFMLIHTHIYTLLLYFKAHTVRLMHRIYLFSSWCTFYFLLFFAIMNYAANIILVYVSLLIHTRVLHVFMKGEISVSWDTSFLCITRLTQWFGLFNISTRSILQFYIYIYICITIYIIF